MFPQYGQVRVRPQHPRVPDRRALRPRPPATHRHQAAGGAPASDGPGPPPPAHPEASRMGPRENALQAPEYRAMLATLQEARIAAGLTLESVAARLDRPVSYVWKCEHGERRVDAIELWRFAGLYGRPVAYFLPAHAFGTGPSDAGRRA